MLPSKDCFPLAVDTHGPCLSLAAMAGPGTSETSLAVKAAQSISKSGTLTPLRACLAVASEPGQTLRDLRTHIPHPDTQN